MQRSARQGCNALLVKLFACVSVRSLFALSFCGAVLSQHVGWERSQLKAKLCSLCEEAACCGLRCCSNELFHLLQPSLCCQGAEGQTTPEQHDVV